MLSSIKKELLKDPFKIVKVLEIYEFKNIVVRNKYIQCGRDETGSKKSIVIQLYNNDHINVRDYPKNIFLDLFAYIMNQRKVEFMDVLTVVKSILNITDFEHLSESKTAVFGGFYERRRQKINTVKTYDIGILEQYKVNGNLRFLKDNISLETQKHFMIGYDMDLQAITIPIWNQYGQLMGVKVRANYNVEDGDLKYFYAVPCFMSETLYGYAQNYEHISNGTVYIFESEKSVLQSFSYGLRNCLALGSSSISKKQCQMILELQPETVIFMFDKGIDPDVIERNIEIFRKYSRMKEIEIGYWNSANTDYKDKVSPSDMGFDVLKDIIKNQIIMTTGGETDERKL